MRNRCVPWFLGFLLAVIARPAALSAAASEEPPATADSASSEPVSAAELLSAEEKDAFPEEPETILPSFGVELEGLKAEVNISAYGDVEFRMEEEGPFTFDQGHANPIVGARIGESFYAEIEIEFEHGGDEKFLEYAFVDWTPWPVFGIRAGKSLVPVGYFNENLHPSFRNRMASRPLVDLQIVPSTWSDTGVQLKGDLEPGAGVGILYRLFVYNGLLEPEGDEGGSIRDMRGSQLDLENRGKSFGGRLEAHEHFGTNYARLGVSGYYGPVSRDGKRTLSMAVADSELQWSIVNLQFEGAAAWLEKPNDRTVVRYGLYVQGALGITSSWDLVLRYDLLGEPDLDGRTHQSVTGVRYAINPHLRWFLEGTARWDEHEAVEPIGRTMFAFSF